MRKRYTRSRRAWEDSLGTTWKRWWFTLGAVSIRVQSAGGFAPPACVCVDQRSWAKTPWRCDCRGGYHTRPDAAFRHGFGRHYRDWRTAESQLDCGARIRYPRGDGYRRGYPPQSYRTDDHGGRNTWNCIAGIVIRGFITMCSFSLPWPETLRGFYNGTHQVPTY